MFVRALVVALIGVGGVWYLLPSGTDHRRADPVRVVVGIHAAQRRELLPLNALLLQQKASPQREL